MTSSDAPESTDSSSLPPSDVTALTPRPRGRAWLAWIVIIAVAGFLAFGRSLFSEREERAEADESTARALMNMQGRYIVGAEDILKQKVFLESVQALRRGEVGQRLRFVVLAGELGGADDALKELDRLDKDMAAQGVKPTKDEARIRLLLGRLYQDCRRGRLHAPSLGPAERTYLRQQFGWFGDLALVPASAPVGEEEIAPVAGGAAAAALAGAANPNLELRQAVLAPARRTFAVLFGSAAAFIFLGFCGFVGLMVLLSLALAGRVRSGVRTGTGQGAIYAETFAVWMVLYPGLTLASSQISLGIPRLLQLIVFMLLSLIALGWPVLRGISWQQVRADVGLTLGRNPVLEPAIGLACYAMALPILSAGLVVTLVLFFLQQRFSGAAGDPFHSGGIPAHPIVGPLTEGTLQDRLLVVVLAAVIAPIVEEIMFRGVLYCHVREASARLGTAFSFIVSATFVSFIFAVIHPQGIIAVPALMAVAFGLTVAREWRGTLIPGMIGHGLNNALVTLLLLALTD